VKFLVKSQFVNLGQVRVKGALVDLVPVLRIELHERYFLVSPDLHPDEFNSLVQVKCSALDQPDKGVRLRDLSLHELVSLLHDFFLLIIYPLS